MRAASLVLVAYAVMLVLGVLWHGLGPIADARPEVAGVTAAYLGLTARSRLAGAVLASIVTGYLADLLYGVPVGLFALIAGMLCILGHLVHRRLLVRGWGVTFVFSFLVGLTASLLIVIVRVLTGQYFAAFWTELWWLFGSGLSTALIGPPLLRLYRRIDAAFARTHRERDAALEGLVP